MDQICFDEFLDSLRMTWQRWHEVSCRGFSALENVQVVNAQTHILTYFCYVSQTSVQFQQRKERPSESRNVSPVAGSISPFVSEKNPDILGSLAWSRFTR